MFVEKIAVEVIARLPLTCKRWEPSAHEESCNYHSLFTSRRPFISIESSSLSFEFFSQAQNAEKRQRNSIRAIWQTPWQSTCILATIKMASWTVLTKNIKLSIIKSSLHQWNMSSENTSSNTIWGDIYFDRFRKIVFLLKSKLEHSNCPQKSKFSLRLDLKLWLRFKMRKYNGGTVFCWKCVRWMEMVEYSTSHRLVSFVPLTLGLAALSNFAWLIWSSMIICDLLRL